MSVKTAAIEAKLAEIRERNGYQLAGDADCAAPDAVGSAGWNFLTSVATDLVEAVEYQGEDFDPDNFEVREIADAAPDVYTYTRWQEFVDLAAYQEDPSELMPEISDMTDAAGVCLYIIAERLASTLVDEIREAIQSADEDDEEGGEE